MRLALESNKSLIGAVTLGIFPLILVVLVLCNAVLVVWLFLSRRAVSSRAGEIRNLQEALSQQFSNATADMASRLEQTKGDLRQQVADRLADGFSNLRSSFDAQMKSGRQEQAERLAETRS